MKMHTILKTFKGSQTGTDHDEFMEGTTRPLSEGLAAIAVAEGWAEPHEPEELTGGPHPAIEPCDPDAPHELVEAKSLGDAPENKALNAAPENKKKKR